MPILEKERLIQLVITVEEMPPEEFQEFVKGLASRAVKIAKDFNVTLDYTPDSIPELEEICERTYIMYKPTWWQKIRGKARSVDAPAEILGAYFGEVMRPLIKGSWIVDKKDGRWGLKSDKGTCYPISKVWKRLTNGDEDNLVFAFQSNIRHLS